ncbi:glycosyltransferase family 2 protein [Polynucleobacter paneuropaeus]|nr:glycosyltransferase family 2 protein [Polynucleobacter paneuropaeus]
MSEIYFSWDAVMLSDYSDLEISRAPVSVVIPCFRCAETIERAVNSIVDQKLQPSELILVDDFSDDGFVTREKLLSFMQLPVEFTIKVIECLNNMGPGTARNIGWESASHPYIAFLDADDSWHPQKIMLQYSLMKNNPDCVISAHESFKLMGEKDCSVGPVNAPKVVEINIRNLLFKNLFPTRSVMLKANLKHRFRDKKKYSEDYLLWLEILGNHNRALFIRAPLSFSYKNDYGIDGLNGSLIKSEIGELKTLLSVYKGGYIGIVIYLSSTIFSIMKFFRRFFVVFYLKNL